MLASKAQKWGTSDSSGVFHGSLFLWHRDVILFVGIKICSDLYLKIFDGYCKIYEKKCESP